MRNYDKKKSPLIRGLILAGVSAAALTSAADAQAGRKGKSSTSGVRPTAYRPTNGMPPGAVGMPTAPTTIGRTRPGMPPGAVGMPAKPGTMNRPGGMPNGAVGMPAKPGTINSTRPNGMPPGAVGKPAAPTTVAKKNKKRA